MSSVIGGFVMGLDNVPLSVLLQVDRVSSSYQEKEYKSFQLARWSCSMRVSNPRLLRYQIIDPTVGPHRKTLEKGLPHIF